MSSVKQGMLKQVQHDIGE